MGDDTGKARTTCKAKESASVPPCNVRSSVRIMIVKAR